MNVINSSLTIGAEIITNCTVKRILHISSNNKDGEKNHEPTVLLSNDIVRGIELVDGSVIETSTVISAATAYHTFTELIRADELRIPSHASTDPLEKFIHHVNHTGNAVVYVCCYILNYVVIEY
jgi:phytoene dehydrogenase-like protein